MEASIFLGAQTSCLPVTQRAVSQHASRSGETAKKQPEEQSVDDLGHALPVAGVVRRRRDRRVLERFHVQSGAARRRPGRSQRHSRRRLALVRRRRRCRCPRPPRHRPIQGRIYGRGAGGPRHRPPTNRGLPTKPFIFYFSLMIDAYETTT